VRQPCSFFFKIQAKQLSSEIRHRIEFYGHRKNFFEFKKKKLSESNSLQKVLKIEKGIK
jgi:hypothetical protein